jgi:hypothetical protein
MILIFSGIGATRMYADQAMMTLTLNGFLNSLRQQKDKDFRLFLSYHNLPDVKMDDAFIELCPMGVDLETAMTKIPKARPMKVTDEVAYRSVPYESGIDDLSRKIENSVIMAARWASQHGLKEFWMLRMDSDDLLANDTIKNIHDFDGIGARAVFNRKCHMFDPKNREIAIHRYPYSTTCHGLKFVINNDGTLKPDWYYLCMDHTLFYSRVQRDKIPVKELDFAYCIVTNSGNSLSGRPEISRERYCEKIPLTKELIDRYGIWINQGS